MLDFFFQGLGRGSCGTRCISVGGRLQIQPCETENSSRSELNCQANKPSSTVAAAAAADATTASSSTATTTLATTMNNSLSNIYKYQYRRVYLYFERLLGFV